MISIRDEYEEPIYIKGPITGFQAKLEWFNHYFAGWFAKDIFINSCINNYNISTLDKRPIQDIDIIENGEIIINYRIKGGSKTSKYPSILAYFIILTILFMYLLISGNLPILCKIYSYLINYITYIFVNLPYIRLILEPFNDISKSTMPFILKCPIYIVKFIFTSLITIIQYGIMFIFLYGFFTIGLFIALFWIHNQPIQQAVKRARSVANILTLLYLMFYTIVLFPQFVKGFLIWTSDMMNNNPIGMILRSISNLFNFTLIPLFTWISSIHTSYTVNRIDALESTNSNYQDLISIIMKINLDTTDVLDISLEESYETLLTKLKSIDIIPIRSIANILTDAILMKKIEIPSEIGGTIVLAFMADYLDSNKLEQLKVFIGNDSLPSKSMRYIAKNIMKFIKIILNLINVYNEIAPHEMAFQMKTGGTVAGYMTSIGFVISFIILSITG